MESKAPVGFVIFTVLFFVLIGFIFYEMFRTHAVSGLALLLPTLLLTIDYTTLTEWNFLRYNKNFITTSGVIGVCESKLEFLDNGLAKLKVSFRKDYVPEKEWYRMEGFKGFMSYIANRVTYNVIAPHYFFKSIDGKESEAIEGAYLFRGRLDKKPQEDDYGKLMLQLKEQDNLISLMETTYERANELSNTLALNSNNDMVESQKKLSIILKDLGEAFTNKGGMPITSGVRY